VPLIIYMVYHFGDEVDRIVRIIKRFQFGIFGVIILATALITLKWWLGHRKLKRAG
jgi:membrane protein DedA with SNARE-associated domain